MIYLKRSTYQLLETVYISSKLLSSVLNLFSTVLWELIRIDKNRFLFSSTDKNRFVSLKYVYSLICLLRDDIIYQASFKGYKFIAIESGKLSDINRSREWIDQMLFDQGSLLFHTVKWIFTKYIDEKWHYQI